MNKHFYLVQAGCLYGNTYYLPYAVGMLAAFALDDARVRAQYSLKRIVYRLEDPDESISGLDNPALVGFSNSIWNYKYNLVYAEKLKQKFPECLIVFGGHHIPPDMSYLEQYDFVDVLIHRKGEEAFRDVLLAAAGAADMAQIPNISYRTPDGKIRQNAYQQITLSDYPSPYLNGIFDGILRDGTYPFSCVLETNRGCPYNCCYCDWGELNTRVRLFPLERVFAELEWMAEHKMEFVYCVDANFGMFERDEQIAQKLVDLKTAYGFPNRLQVSYSKDSFERVFRINKLLSEHGIGKGATLALQSLSADVLKIIGRKNISREEYAMQAARYNDAGISTYTELILGLPGETLDSFKHGLCELLEMGQHSSVSAYYCELLPNARLSEKNMIERFGIKTVTTCLNQYHCESMDNVLSGSSNIVVETNTMSAGEWIEANLFAVCAQSFHHFGLLQCVAMYARHARNVSYYDFYDRLYRFILHDTVFCKKIFADVSQVLHDFVDGKGGLTFCDSLFGEITYPLEEAVFLLCLSADDTFYAEVARFAKQFFTDQMLFRELFAYQKKLIVRPGQRSFTARYSYDFKGYFHAILGNQYTPLVRKESIYRYSTPFYAESWEEYAKIIVWYGRRNRRMLFYSPPNQIDDYPGM